MNKRQPLSKAYSQQSDFSDKSKTVLFGESKPRFRLVRRKNTILGQGWNIYSHGILEAVSYDDGEFFYLSSYTK